MAKDRYINTSDKRGGYKVKYKGRLFAFLVLILVIALAVFVNSSFFHVGMDTVEVVGDERFHFDDIKNAAKEYLQDVNIFQLDEPAIESIIEMDNPYLDVTDIVRKLPNVVQIVVKERETVFQFAYNGEYFNAAFNGVVMSEARSKDPALIQVEGLVIEAPQRGQAIQAINEQQQKDFDELVYNLQAYNFIPRVKCIDLSEETNLLLYLESDFKVIIGLPTQLQGKISCLDAAVKSVLESGNTSGTLDISVVGNIYFVPSGDNE